MEREKNNIPSRELNPEIENVEKFRDLFAFLDQERLGEEYKATYEETAELAKQLIEGKTKATWSRREFEKNMASQHPRLPRVFIEALGRCVEHYNPPVNLPEEPAW